MLFSEIHQTIISTFSANRDGRLRPMYCYIVKEIGGCSAQLGEIQDSTAS